MIKFEIGGIKNYSLGAVACQGWGYFGGRLILEVRGKSKINTVKTI